MTSLGRSGEDEFVAELDSLSPLDGRYHSKLECLRKNGFTQRSLILEKIDVELKWLEWLLCGSCVLSPGAEIGEPPWAADPLGIHAATLPHLVPIRRFLKALKKASLGLAPKILEIDGRVRHDTKAVETALRSLLLRSSSADSSDVLPAPDLPDGMRELMSQLLHFALTSEDVTNLAYAKMMVRTWKEVVVPSYMDLRAILFRLIDDHKSSAMMGMTHGQSAVGTTFGKELAVFLHRLQSQKVADLENVPVKFGGAVGNHNALLLVAQQPGMDRASAPEHLEAGQAENWTRNLESFLRNVDPRFRMDVPTTQIANREWIAELLHKLVRVNSIVTDLVRDMWLYCSRGLLKLRVVKEEVGSSTMPHKVNPINFENAEGNARLASSILTNVSEQLLTSRMQRDLSDSTVIRSLGVAIGHTILAWTQATAGLERVAFNDTAAQRELDGSYEVLAEALQTRLRHRAILATAAKLRGLPHSEGEVCESDPYDILKQRTRDGTSWSQDQYKSLATDLGVEELSRLTPSTYIGLAPQFCEYVLSDQCTGIEPNKASES